MEVGSSGIRMRVAYCVLIVLLVSAGLSAGIFEQLEERAYSWIMADSQFGSLRLPLPAEIGALLLVCLIPAVVRMDQPLVLIACSTWVAFVYTLIASVVLLINDIALPLSPSFLTLIGCSSVAGALSWSDERSSRKRLELLEASRQQLTDMLVHDLKRRMSSILMTLSVLEKDEDDSVLHREAIMQTIRASAERMLLLTGNLLGIRRIESTNMVVERELVSLRSLVQESLRDHGSAGRLAGVHLTELEAHDMDVRLDRSLMLRVMTNLIWNAIQHAPEGTTIELAYGADDDDHVVISVANRGGTIPPENMTRLFDAFESGSSGPEDSLTASTGLGLTFCRLAIEAHDGTIALESPWEEHGDGVRAVVRLPLK